MRTLALFAAALLVGCASDAPADDVPEAMAPEPVAEATEPTVADDAPVAEPAAAEDPAYRIVSAANGDRACYLELAPADGGAQESAYADFEVCYEIETEDLTGQLVTLTTETGTIMAESCEGDIDCRDTDTVDLVMSIARVE